MTLIFPSQLPFLPFISKLFPTRLALKAITRRTGGRESEGKGNKSNRIQASGIFSQLERRTSPPAKQVGSARAEIRDRSARCAVSAYLQHRLTMVAVATSPGQKSTGEFARSSALGGLQVVAVSRRVPQVTATVR